MVRCTLECGPEGASLAAARGDIIVIVDVLCFTTCVGLAVSRQAEVYPCSESDDVFTLADNLGGVAGVRRREVPQRGMYSLSPPTYLNIQSGTKVLLRSPNGAFCSLKAAPSSLVLAGALVNARAIGDAAVREATDSGHDITVVACGEARDPQHPAAGARFALEDYLGVGAIIAHIGVQKSIEAQVCEETFLRYRDRLLDLLLECQSGKEQVDYGYRCDVDYSAQLDILDSVPMLDHGWYRSFHQTKIWPQTDHSN